MSAPDGYPHHLIIEVVDSIWSLPTRCDWSEGDGKYVGFHPEVEGEGASYLIDKDFGESIGQAGDDAHHMTFHGTKVGNIYTCTTIDFADGAWTDITPGQIIITAVVASPARAARLSIGLGIGL